MAYSQLSWNTGDPITQEKMRKIEKGIYDAHVTADSSSNSITNLNAILSELSTTVSNQASSIQLAQLDIATAQESTIEGSKAWTLIVPLLEFEEDNVTIKKNLATRITTDEGSISKNTNLIATLQGQITDALSVGDLVYDAANARFKNAESLAERIGEINRLITIATATANGTSTIVTANNIVGRLNALDANEDITSEPYIMSVPELITEIKSARGKNKTGGNNLALNARLDFVDGGGNAPSRTLPDIITEIDNTHRDNVTNDTLDKRLDDIDNVGSSANLTHLYRINQLETEINDARQGSVSLDARLDGIDSTAAGKVAKTDIKKTLTYETDDNSVLLARLGYLLQLAINTLDSNSTEAIGGLDARLETAEGAITTLNGNASTSGSVLNTVNTRIAEVVNSAPEAFDTLKEIADWIGENSDDALTMQQNISNNADAISALLTRATNIESAATTLTGRVSSIETVIDHTQGENDEVPNGLKQRITALETSVDTAESGLLDRMTAVENKSNTTATDLTALTGRVTTLETEPKSATVIIESVTYDSNGDPTSILNPSTDVDYLLKKDDKYYYWKYIKTGTNPDTYKWALISGAGGGGTSSAAIVASLPSAIDANKDTDYYVGDNNNGYVHYRFIPTITEGTETLIPIPIANYIDSDEINNYRLLIRDIPISEGSEETSKWLFLYKFGYGEPTDIDSEETFTDPIWATRLVDAIPLPAGGGGSSPQTTLKVTRITPRAITAPRNSIENKTYLQFFFTDGEAGETYRYSLTLNGKVVIPSSTNTEITSGDPINKSSTWPTKTEIINGETTIIPMSTTEVPIGFYSIDITPYCTTLGPNQPLVLTITSESNLYISASTTWDLTVIQFNLSSNAVDGLIVNRELEVSLSYTPTGAIEKVLHIDIGEHKYTRTLLASATGKEYEFIIPANSESHGAHTIDMYMTTVINGNKTLTTDHIYKLYIWYDPNMTEDSTIIASPKADTGILVESYTDILIPYSVYHKDAGNYNIYYYLNYGTQSEKLIDSVQANGNYIDTINYTPYTTSGEIENQTITIKVDNIELVINVQVSPISADVSPVSKPIIDFDPAGLSNNSINRLPSWNVDSETYSITTSNNFNWSNDISGGGYKEDEDGKCFVIKAGSYIDLNYPLFQRGLHTESATSTVFDRGAEMKIIFKVGAVRNINAVWFSNIGTYTGKTVGIQLGAHSGWLKTDKAADTQTNIVPDEDGVLTINDATYNIWKPNTAYVVDDLVVLYDENDEDNHMTIFKCIANCSPQEQFLNSKGKVDTDHWLASGKIDTEILATNSYLYMPYSEEDRIELDININKYVAASKNNFIMAYEDGVPSKVYSYTYGAGGDSISHNNTIRIGSPDCDVYIYRLRIYNKSLNTNDILQNFIADGKDIKEKLKRYNRNCIYWNQGQGRYYPTPDEDSVLDPVRLALCIPNVKVLMLDTPVFTTGKKNYIMNSSLRCIHAVAPEDYDGNIYYASRGDADNWFFQNGFHAGQGTTSDNYGQSGRNVDFLFEVDGLNWPAVEKDIKVTYNKANYPNYKSSVLIGNSASTWEETEEGSGIYHWVPTREPVESEICLNWKGDNCKVSLTQSSVPNNYFNLKVNVASSENVNNALFQARYSQFINDAYPSPATAALKLAHANTYANINDIKVKNGMEFVPAILFVRENQVDELGNPKGHNEFNDCNWHFYALGNIGDSKKTDYTRAYDPTDINEFTCENSDNNTNNGQFQSGVFTYNGHRAIETPYEAYNNSKTYNSGDIVVDDGIIKVYDGTNWSNATLSGWTDETVPYFAPFTAPNTMEYLYPISPSEWNVKIGSNWINYKHYTLVKEKFDGDHSFEFRYACKGDYRDGKLINDTNGDSDIPNTDPETMATKPFLTKDDVLEKLNHNVMLAFYEWIVTSDPTQYVNEAPLWFVKPAMEFFYAYTHYYTMMDNRAKNTFWHFAKTDEWKKIPIGRAVPALFHIYEEDDGNGGHKPVEGSFDNNKLYWTQYAFDLWAYDMDTAAGIDNNGALVFPYGKEDTDYRTEGDPASGYAFNGAGSIFWRRLSTTFRDEIVNIMNSADASCFNSLDLIDSFDHFQECFPEEIWRLDIERKYIRTFTGLPVDNSVTKGKQNPRFLTSMMLGRKKYQRRQWIRDLGVYFNSKYRLNDIIANENTIEFNCTTPAIPEWAEGTSYTVGLKVFYAPEPAEGETINRRVYRCIQSNSDLTFNSNKWVEDVTPTYHLSLTPYLDMYLNVQVGNGNYQSSYVTNGEPTLRAKAGQEYIFDITGNYQETRIYINGANYLSGIGNLAPMYPYSFDLRALAHIKTLDIGTDDSGYVNTKFTELKLPDYIPLLETLNIKNCHSVAGTIELTNANNIRTVVAEGTAISGISLPDYTNIETLHIPSTMTALNLYGARFLSDFKVINSAGNLDYGALYKLHIFDSDYSLNVNWFNIALAMLTKQSILTEISLLGLNTTTIGNIQELEPLKEFKKILEPEGGLLELTGILHVTGDWSIVEKNIYKTVWPRLDYDTIPAKEKTKCAVTYWHSGYMNDGIYVYPQEITTVFVDAGTGIVPDIYEGKSIAELPSRDPTIASVFSFGSYNEDGYIPYSGWTSSTEDNAVSLYEEGYSINNPLLPLNGQLTMNLYTYYNTTDHEYTVLWKINDTIVKSVTNQGYGGGYTLKAPTVSELRAAGILTATVTLNSNGTYSYSIFNGWDKLPTNITPTLEDAQTSTYVINAVWKNVENKPISDSDPDSIFYDTTNLTAEQLLVLSRLGNTTINNNNHTSSIIPTRRFEYLMGYEGAKTGITLINNNNIKRIGATTIPQYVRNITDNSNVYPFALNQGFTIAIDYLFGAINNGSLPEVLVGCYDKDSGNSIIGFALYRGYSENNGGLGTFISFGVPPYSNDTSKRRAVGDAFHRNIIVLRHEKNSGKLHIYTAQSSIATTSLNTSLVENTVIDLTTLNLSNEAQICIGNLRPDLSSKRIDDTNPNSALKFSDELNNVRGALGSVYWMKYWDEDLGAGECLQLAAWPHEKMTAVITGVNTNSSYSTNINPKLFFTNLNCSGHANVSNDTFTLANGNAIGPFETGWSSSNTKLICDNRIFNGLPLDLQSIVCKPGIGYFNYTSRYEDETIANLSSLKTDELLTGGYVYVPSISSLDSEYSGIEQNKHGYESIYEFVGNTLDNTSAITPYTWLKTPGTVMNVQRYVGGDPPWVLVEPLAYWFNIRFKEKPIVWSTSNKMNIYIIDSSVTGSGTFYSIIGSSKIKSNDIVIYTKTNNSGTVVDSIYMYVSASEQTNGGIQTLPQTDLWKTGAANTVDGGWIKSTSYVTRSVPSAKGRVVNYIYIDEQGSTLTPIDANSQAAAGSLGLDFAFAI